MKNIIYILIAIVISSVQLFSQQSKGDVELQIAGSITYTASETGSGLGMVQGKYGYFYTDKIEIGVSPTISYSFGGETDPMIGAGLFGNYSMLLADGITAPYIGGLFHFHDINDLGNSSSIGVSLGLKRYFSKKIALDIGISASKSLMEGADFYVIMSNFGISILI